MNHYMEGDLVKIVSIDFYTTGTAGVLIGDVYEVIAVDEPDGCIQIATLLGDAWVDMEDIELIIEQPTIDEVATTEIEQLVAQKAIENYRIAKADNKRIEELLKTKTYHLNDYVVDVTFGVGKIVGYDEEHNYYRVRFNDWMNFVGREEDILMPYEGEVPQELADYDPNVVNYVWGFYLDDTVAEDMED